MNNEEKIVYRNVDELIPYENNPRINDEAVEFVANSIREFGFKNPIIIDKNDVIIAGHTRLKSAKKLGITRVPTITADDLTEEQIKAFRIADNKVAEYSKWDYIKLGEELGGLANIDMSEFGLEKIEVQTKDEDKVEVKQLYTSKVNIPQYEITGDEPPIEALVDTDRADELAEKIEQSNVSPEQKEFLIKATKHLYTFNYRNIAEYYAHQDKEMQQLMEDLALVIIDINDAIAKGYAKLKLSIDEAYEEEDDDE